MQFRLYARLYNMRRLVVVVFPVKRLTVCGDIIVLVVVLSASRSELALLLETLSDLLVLLEPSQRKR